MELTFGEALRIMRQRRGMTVEKLAVEAGVSYDSIRNYEIRGMMPKLDALQLICKALGCKPQDLADFPSATISEDAWEAGVRYAR